MRLGKPKESNRDRTWFSAFDAGVVLREGRKKIDGRQIALVIEKAVTRIQQLRGGDQTNADFSQDYLQRDALRKIQFEAVAPTGYIQSRLSEGQNSSSRIGYAGGRRLLQGELLPFKTQAFEKDLKFLPAKRTER